MRTLNLVVTILSAIIWRSGRVLKNNMFTKPNFTAGYYNNGDFDTHCQTVRDASSSLKFCEDATFWDLFDGAGKLEERKVIIGCDPGRKSWNTVMGPLLNPDPRGDLWLYAPGKVKNANRAAPKPVPQKIRLKGYPEGHDFHPLGLEIYPSYAGNLSNLFVVNHARQRSSIEQFTLSPTEPTQATWVRTITSGYLVSPNSIALTSPTSFYVSNDHLLTRRLPSPLGHILPITESVLGLPLSWLSHISLSHSDSSLSVVNHTFAALGIPFANGVAISPDGKQLALSATSMANVLFYSRSEDNTLKYTGSVPVPFTPDNIAYDEEGVLIVTGHPHFPSLINVAANKTNAVAPSWVVAISPRDAEAGSPHPIYDTKAPVSSSAKVPSVPSHTLETLFQSDGIGFSTSCTGLRDSRTDTLYITGLYAEGLMVCQ